jgi:DNA-binding beta-propeller fold protein YncE
MRKAILLYAFMSASSALADDFVHFESSHVHPIAISESGDRVYAVNTPEGRLSAFDVGAAGDLSFAKGTFTGLEPVSVALHPEAPQAWVVNQVSDTVSVVELSGMRVVDTLRVGDQPTDLVFAGGRAFISLSGKDDQVVVYDAATRELIGVIEIFGNSPRAFAASSDGSRVYLVVLESGNRTSVVRAADVAAMGGPPAPNPPMNPSLSPPPATTLIVKFDAHTEAWRDETGEDWSSVVPWSVPDYDLFVIDAAATVPSVIDRITDVGTILFDVLAHPVSGHLFIPNTEARNHIRFAPNLQGRLVETRISEVDVIARSVAHHDLNGHIDHSIPGGSDTERSQSIAQPGNGVFSGDGSRCFVTSFGTAKVGVLDGVTMEIVDRIAVGGGPSGVALNESADRLYVVNRFDNTISIVDTSQGLEVDVIGIAGPSAFDPSPDHVRDGRRFLYDAVLSSAHGDNSCATCHVFGNIDQIGWDLGDPTGSFESYFALPWIPPLLSSTMPPRTIGFHPMKGVMVTQTLRGLTGQEPLHWRGDRQNFQQFNGAFIELFGRASELLGSEMDLFTDFIHTVRLPPNPNRGVDGALPAELATTQVDDTDSPIFGNPLSGEALFTESCSQCHAFPDGSIHHLQGTNVGQDMKVPHLRNLYEKVDFRGRPGEDYKSGFGIFHFGAFGITQFLEVFFQEMAEPARIRDIESFVLAFDSGTPPCVGHQIGIPAEDAFDANREGEITQLLSTVTTSSCDVIVTGTVASEERGYLYDSSAGGFVPDSVAYPSVSDFGLRSLLEPGDVITYTGVPVGTGHRSVLDRDRDGSLNADEVIGESDPADPAMSPSACDGALPRQIGTVTLRVKNNANPSGDERIFARGRFRIPRTLLDSVDPIADGVLFRMKDACGSIIFERALSESARWRADSSGAAWIYDDEDGLASGGLRRVKVRRRGNDPGLVDFRLVGYGADYRIPPHYLPISVDLVLGDESEALWKCGSVALDTNACAYSRSGDTLRCRRNADP